MRCMLLQVRAVVNARHRGRWNGGQTRDDSSVCWRETPPLTSSSSVLNSNLFFFFAMTFSLFDLIYFIHGLGGKHFLSALCSQSSDAGAGSCESILLQVVLAGLDVRDFKPLTQNSRPLDRVDLMCSQNNEVWRLTPCKNFPSQRRTLIEGRRDSWTDERWTVWEMDGWLEG